MKILSNKKHFKGFTLVELIIVITILAILGTIAYISFQGYTKDARDGTRMSDIKQIYNGLSIYKTQTEKTPMPDSYVNILSGTTTISYQGYAGANVLRTLRITGGKDPGTKDYYIYSTDVNTKKAQLMTYMETSDKDVQLLSQLKEIKLLNQVNALTNTGYYQDKKIYVYGDKIGILTDSNKVPLQETTTLTGIDISTSTGNITTYFGGTIYNSGTSTSTGQTLVNQIVGAINNTKVCDTGYSLIGGNCVAQNIEIANSLRFDGSRSTYIKRDYSTIGNRKKWTWSGWVKRTNVGLSDGDQVVFSTPGTSSYNDSIDIRANLGNICLTHNGSGKVCSVNNAIIDPSIWYHLLVKFDTTGDNQNDYIRIYVNGSEVSYSVTNYPAKNEEWNIGNSVQYRIGYANNVIYSDPNHYFKGYMSEINFIDGNAYGPENFGINIGGKWLPKKYEGTYGTNGFHLNFSNSGNLGDDVAGTNDWNLVNYSTPANDQMIDTPTNNFAILNPIDTYSSATLSEGGLVYFGSSNYPRSNASIKVSSGKWYWEAIIDSISSGGGVWGISNVSGLTNGPAGLGNYTGEYGVFTNGGAYRYYNAGLFSGSPITLTTGKRVAIAFDVDNGKIWFGTDLSGSFVWLDGDPSLGLNPGILNIPSGFYSPSFVGNTSSYKWRVNFGQGGQSGLSWCPGAGGYFKNCPPAGFKALSSKNIGN